MSEQAVKEFKKKLARDAGLRAKVQAIDRKNVPAALAQIVKIAAAAGFSFTTEEARRLIRPQASSAELSAKDLDKVAGGGEDGFEWDWGSEEGNN